MGYLLAGLLILVLIGLLIVTFAHSRPPSGTLSGKPEGRDKPSAEEATPDASTNAAPEQVENARRRTPPG